MSNAYFTFQQFTIRHDKCAMKVGTDGVLLGAWATINNEKETNYSVLDIGAGTGLIAIMIAQRNNNAIIDAIEIDSDACCQAAENVALSPFKDKISLINKSFLAYTPEKKYDLIISNPPYFDRSLKSRDDKRNTARHNDTLSLVALVEHATTMLSDCGRISLILPVQLSDKLDLIIATRRLYAIRRTDVIPVEGSSPKRFMIEMSTNYRHVCDANTLVLETKAHKRTHEYAELTKDFYL